MRAHLARAASDRRLGREESDTEDGSRARLGCAESGEETLVERVVEVDDGEDAVLADVLGWSAVEGGASEGKVDEGPAHSSAFDGVYAAPMPLWQPLSDAY